MPSTATFLGDYNLDVVVNPDEYRIKGKNFWFRQDGQERTLTATDLTQDRPRILPGSKPRVSEDLDEIVQGLVIESEDSGGGGQNTARAWGKFGNGNSKNGIYADLTQRTERLAESLSKAKIDGIFLGAREPRKHLVLNIEDMSRPDRPRENIIFRPQKFQLVDELDPEFEIQLRAHVQGRDALMLNSPKDLLFISCALECAGLDIPVYANITKSFPRAFGIKYVLPRVSASFSRGDALRYARTILREPVSPISNDVIMNALWNAMDKPKDDRFLILTEASEGAWGQDRRGRYHVGLASSYRAEIQPQLKKALGAGDTFIAYAMHAHLVNGIKRVDEIMQYATQGVLTHMGFAGNVPFSAYVVEKA